MQNKKTNQLMKETFFSFGMCMKEEMKETSDSESYNIRSYSVPNLSAGLMRLLVDVGRDNIKSFHEPNKEDIGIKER